VGGGRPTKHSQQKSIQPILGTASPRSPSRSQSPDKLNGELQESGQTDDWIRVSLCTLPTLNGESEVVEQAGK